MKTKKLGIMKNINFGCREIGIPVLWFDIYVDENIGALEVLFLEQYCNMLKKHGIINIKDLERHPCWVIEDSEENTLVFEDLVDL